MKLKGWLTGTVELEIVSADINRVINTLMDNGVSLSKVNWLDELSVQISVLKKDYDKIEKLSKEFQCDIKHIKTAGLSVFLSNALKRPVLAAGLLAFLLLSIWLPKRILFIQVNGNSLVSSKEIIEHAESCGLTFGTVRRQIRSEQIKNNLLERLPQLQWVGINTAGCVATINVKERTEQTEQQVKEAEPSSIVAAKDGVIRSVTAQRGAVCCQVGQAVTKGDTLISGYTDCGSAIVYTRAEGEVFADTNTILEVVTLHPNVSRSKMLHTETRYSIIIGKNLIKLYKDSGILDATCVKIYKQYDVMLPGGFILPAKVIAETIEYYSCGEQPGDLTECPWLLDRGNEYLQSQMIAGQILSCEGTFIGDEFSCGYSLNYACNEMIGQIKKEEIFDLHG